MEIYESSKDVVYSKKDDDSPLTQADINAHEVISHGLEELNPMIPMVFPVSCQPPFLFHTDCLSLNPEEKIFRESPNMKHRASSETDRRFVPPVHPKAIFLRFKDSWSMLSSPTPYLETIFNRDVWLRTWSVMDSVPTTAASASLKKLISSIPEIRRPVSLKQVLGKDCRNS